MKIRNDFWINWDKFYYYSNKAGRLFDKSLNVKFQSIDFQILRLMCKKYDRIAYRHLKIARKYLKVSIENEN